MPVLFVLIAGLAVTALLAVTASTERDQQRQKDVEAAADGAAHDVRVALDEAIVGARRTIVPMGTSWSSPADYEKMWSIALTSLPGDSAIQTVVQVPAERLDEFVAAERAQHPEFELQFLNPEPPAAGHVITARTSGAEAGLVGVDHSSFEGSEALLERATPGSPSFLGGDMRQQATTVPGQIQVAMAHQISPVDGDMLNAWTIVQIDAATVIAEANGLSTERYGLTVSSPINPELAMLGIEAEADDVFTETRAVSTGDIDLEVQVHSDGTVAGLADPVRVLVIGGALSLVAAVLAAAAVFLMTLMRRAERSDTLARLDELTGLPNRRWLHEHLGQVVEGDVAVLFCDLDRFKIVNDSAGHSVGDELLVGVAERLAGIVGHAHALVRFGGDEFIVVCEPTLGEQSIDVGSGVAQQLVDAMSEPFNLGTTTFRTSMSVGVAFGPVADRAAIDKLIRRADTALAECKRGGRNGYRVYDTQLQDAETDRLSLEQELQVALDRGEMVVHYQPIVDEANEVRSFEALVRWERNGTLVPPGVFLPVVADMGRMEDLGAIVRAQAISQLNEWSASGRFGDDLTMHVNVAATELVDRTFPDRVLDELNEHQVSSSQLVFEVCEDQWLDFNDGYLEVFEHLAELGIGIAIDDFGIGYSSIARILNLPGVTEFKIDRSLVCQIDQPAGRALLVGLLEIGRALGVEVVAEGVETIEEHRALFGAGITKFQGYLFARPAPAELVALPGISPLSRQIVGGETQRNEDRSAPASA